MKKDVELNVITKLKMVLIKIAGRGCILIDFFGFGFLFTHDSNPNPYMTATISHSDHIQQVYLSLWRHVGHLSNGSYRTQRKYSTYNRT